MAKRRRKRKKKRTFLVKGMLMVICSLLFVSAGLAVAGKKASKAISVTQMQVKAYDLAVTHTGQEPVFPRGVSAAGMSLEGKTMAQAQAIVEEYIQARKSRAVTFSVFGTELYEYNGEMLGVSWNNPEVMDELAQTLPGTNFVGQYKNQKNYEQEPVDFPIELSCNEAQVRQEVQKICGSYTVQAVNAGCRLENGRMTVTPGTTGRSFDAESIAAQCLALVNDCSSTELVAYDFPYTEVQPQYGTEAFSFAWSVLGEYSTNNLGGGNREHNIALSAQNMNGSVILPGEEASVMQRLYGDVSEAGGYLKAPTYQQGQQVDDISGGICQTTSTLYNALLLAEMEIVSRSQHSMLVTYVPPSLDAMVNMSGGDFKFRNSSSSPIYIESFVWNDTLIIRIWGKEERPANRTVKYESQPLEIVWPDPLYEDYVNDSVTTVGLVDGTLKAKAVVEAHPYVHSISYKVIYIDGVEVSREVLTEDRYTKKSGQMYHASDCRVINADPVEEPGGVYRFLGKGYALHHRITFLNGEGWDANDPNGYYGK